MKIYRGQPGGQVTVEEDGKVTVLPLPTNANTKAYDWGNGGKEAGNLARALAENFLGDSVEARQLHQILKHRLLMPLNRDTPWEVREQAFKAYIDDARESVRDGIRMRGIVAQQPAPVVYEGGGAMAHVSAVKRSQHDSGPGPEVPPERRAQPAQKIEVIGAGHVATFTTPIQWAPAGQGEPVPDDWPEKVDGFRATAGDFVTGTRLVYCLVMCGCYSWQDAAQVPEEKLRKVPQWGDALMAEMMEAFKKRNITYVAKEQRQKLVASALSKLTPEEKEAMGLT